MKSIILTVSSLSLLASYAYASEKKDETATDKVAPSTQILSRVLGEVPSIITQAWQSRQMQKLYGELYAKVTKDGFSHTSEATSILYRNECKERLIARYIELFKSEFPKDPLSSQEAKLSQNARHVIKHIDFTSLFNQIGQEIDDNSRRASCFRKKLNVNV